MKNLGHNVSWKLIAIASLFIIMLGISAIIISSVSALQSDQNLAIETEHNTGTPQLVIPNTTPTDLSVTLTAFYKITPTSSSKVFIVNTLNDNQTSECSSGDCSLREAINEAPFGATINFLPTLKGTITLAKTLKVTKSLTINGPGPRSDAIRIAGNNALPVFSVVGNLILNVNNLTISDGNYVRGGGISNDSAIVNITNCTFQQNSGTMGGAIANIGGTTNITNSLFFGNTAGTGAAIGNLKGLVSVVNSTFQDNKAALGGAIGNLNGNIIITNATFYDNGRSEAIFNNYTGPAPTLVFTSASLQTLKSLPSSVIVRNSIIYNPPAIIGCTGTIIDGGNNLQFPSSDCASTIPIKDPKLGTLANNGGFTDTIALLLGSPAIDSGNNTFCTQQSTTNTDQRNLARSIDGSTGHGAICDIGAYEYNSR